MKSLALAVLLGLAFADNATAELAVPRAQDGMLAVSPNGAPRVAYLRGSTLEIAMRRRTGVWQQERAARVAPGSSLVAFANGVEGPVALVRGPGARTLDVVLREGTGWRMISLARVPARERIGWPGLALQRGLPTVAYSRWRQSTPAAACTRCGLPRAAFRRASSLPRRCPWSYVAGRT
jgi:hypothetical protein